MPSAARLHVLGRREGYSTLWKYRHEAGTRAPRQAAAHGLVDYAKQIGFKGQFYIEPSREEPTKHQYDSDAAAA